MRKRHRITEAMKEPIVMNVIQKAIHKRERNNSTTRDGGNGSQHMKVAAP